MLHIQILIKLTSIGTIFLKYMFLALLSHLSKYLGLHSASYSTMLLNDAYLESFEAIGGHT